MMSSCKWPILYRFLAIRNDDNDSDNDNNWLNQRNTITGNRGVYIVAHKKYKKKELIEMNMTNMSPNWPTGFRIGLFARSRCPNNPSGKAGPGYSVFFAHKTY